MTKDALLEIGSEELPASYIGVGIAQLKAAAEASMKENGLPFTGIHVYGTPRRLAVVISGLPEKSTDHEKMVAGPPVARGKDPSGQWTQAAIGFAAKNGLKPEDLVVQEERLCAVLKIKGVSTRQILALLYPNWIRALQFPKTMVWEPTQLRYPRPIRWMAALFGADLVSFSLAGVRSGRWTLGIGPWAPKKIVIANANKYAILLKNQCVLIETTARQDAIRRYAEQAVKRVHGKVHMSASLLEQVANLVEHPVAIVGNFDPAYLDLPKEVLITCLEHHQKYFPVEQASGGKLLPHFVGIRNGMSVNQDIVREGYERVLAARLADARFFFNQDRKTPLSAKVDALKGVMFQAKLGNLFDKKERVKKLLEQFSTDLGGFVDLEKAKRAADLGKADLVTGIVGEFPELQGIVARIYAQLDGEDPVVAQALEQHYWPITLTGALPASDVAALVALADKLDTLAGDFAVGLIPTGSADPYGLRRAAVGVLRILEDRKWNLNLEQLIAQAVQLQPMQQNAQETAVKLTQFFRQRIAAILEERGFKADEIEAIIGLHIGKVDKSIARLKALHRVRAKAEFESLATTSKRCINILRQAEKVESATNHQIQPDLLKEAAELQLFEVLKKVEVDVSKHLETDSFDEALESMVSLRQPLGEFFDKVMVMSEDRAVKTNRLNLLNSLARVFYTIADFSKLQNG